MPRITHIICFLFLFSPFLGNTQVTDTIPATRSFSDQERFYFTSGAEFIFSFARVDYMGSEDGSLMRFAPFFNFQSFYNYDASPYFGLLAGFSLRNVGFIYEFPDSDIKKKYRTYTIGIPLGLKLGRMNKTFLYGGYELELPFHYKEKTFIDGNKEDKFSVWFSQRTPPIFHSLFFGVQLPYAASFKLKFYLTEFFNQDFNTVENGQTVFPYEGFNAHVFYFSLSFNLFKNAELNISDDF